MTHKGTQVIKTTRLTLRRFTENDAEAMYANWASDPEVTKYLRWKAHPNVNVSRKVLTE
ncbi:MAG TPA: GNAT family N-acetyltransferase, partial [Bacillota bacterium]|nr:GNAT family N-acetyltransferase [Bacillota bacterium]